ncbi:methyltransferase domain-containing protein [Streptomyces sp. H10-C2]|uniref:methyltransferase domain-containing protein n=1 Tax=unclassified Streptomyces TaxID=2593676 RepID=UPI0024BA79C9|nr:MULTISPECIES: methyltransferase domain-containing protein [unclassified Streptomyces]MDJ0346589.1 methyltransferase domain-containing protein [Streptomyces sp. PH10-H1]MDJ0375038.1 methyltransferase domain-containing protein [Streptomyces sp. H10-C2]
MAPDVTAAADVPSLTDAVRDYYGKVLASTADLQTSACCTAQAPMRHVAEALGNVHDEVKDRFYGCGSPIPPALEGLTVLDLGCGSGRDCYVLCQLVGPNGRVIGVDMTDEQLAVANRHLGYHADKFGYANVEFKHGYIEDLGAVGLADCSVDLVVSNCVLNLSPDKPRVFQEIFRVLKPGGELYFSDVFADRRIPAALLDDPVLVGECLSGALYEEDFRRIMARSGCADARVVSSTPLTISNPDIEQKIGYVAFSSRTIRAFSLPLEDRCEDFGQVATYRGTLTGHPHAFDLDDHHRFHTGKPMLVCGNTADMLSRTRYAQHFDVIGEKTTHFGLFPCGPSDQPSAGAASTGAGCC